MHECGFSKRRRHHEIERRSADHASHLLVDDLLSAHAPHHRGPFYIRQSGHIHHARVYARDVQTPGKGCAVFQAPPIRIDEKTTPDMATPQSLARCRPPWAQGYERVLA